MASTWLTASGYCATSALFLAWRLRDSIPAISLLSWLQLLSGVARGALADVPDALVGASLVKALHASQLTALLFANFVASLFLLTAVAMKSIFLGRLSVGECAKLTERLLKFVMLKVVLLGAVVQPHTKHMAVWLSWFMSIGWLKMFLGMARDRLEALLSSPTATLLATSRALLLLLLVVANTGNCLIAYASMLPDDMEALGTVRLPGAHGRRSVLLVWGYDAVVILLEAMHGLLKFGVCVADRWQRLWPRQAERTASEGEGGTAGEEEKEYSSGNWEARGSLLYHADLVSDCTLHILTLAHYWHVWWLHGFAFQLVDALLFLDIRAMSLQLHTRIKAHLRYCAATRALQRGYADASSQQLAACPDCVICRDAMLSAKVLPCGHIFHLACLRAWLQQSGSGNFTCPLCRVPLVPKAAGEEGWRAPLLTGLPAALGWPGGWWRGASSNLFVEMDEWLQANADGALALSDDAGEQEDGAEQGLGPNGLPAGYSHGAPSSGWEDWTQAQAAVGEAEPAAPSVSGGGFDAAASLLTHSWYSAASGRPQQGFGRAAGRQRRPTEIRPASSSSSSDGEGEVTSGTARQARRQHLRAAARNVLAADVEPGTAQVTRAPAWRRQQRQAASHDTGTSQPMMSALSNFE